MLKQRQSLQEIGILLLIVLVLNASAKQQEKCTSCKVPENSLNEQRISLNLTKQLNLNESVPSGTIIINVLHNNNNSELIQPSCGDEKCTSFCPPIITTPSLIATCNLNGKSVDCSKAKKGTVATFKCAPFYENLKKGTTRTCRNGSWGKKLPTCAPTCGSKPDPSQYYPWNVALFRNLSQKNIFRCAGTLIDEKIILTAAHCVTDDFGNKFPVNEYTVAAGKSSTNFSDPQDSDAQYAQVEDIFIPKNFKGSVGKYVDDVVILVTKTAFNMSERIHPMCFDWKKSFSTEFNYPHTKAYIAGPLKSYSLPKLKEVYEIEVPMVSESKCLEMLESQPLRANFREFYTSDKICGGYINSDKVPMCRVDSGVGLVSENQSDNKYYLTGITSLLNAVFYRSGSCDDQRWVLFTNLTGFSGFIHNKTKLYKRRS